MRNLDNFSLIIFGDFGVLTTTPFRDGKLAMLPGRIEFLEELHHERIRTVNGAPLRYAVTGNKGGVAFGLQSEAEGEAEVKWTAEQIGAEEYSVCFAHPHPAGGYEKYADPTQLKRRKPNPGMLNEIIVALGVPRERVLVVGNADDRKAAQDAGLAWETTGMFFAPRPTREERRVVDDFDPFFD